MQAIAFTTTNNKIQRYIHVEVYIVCSISFGTEQSGVTADRAGRAYHDTRIPF